MIELNLNNNIKAVFKHNPNTPRVALCLTFGINIAEDFAGIYSLMNRLLLQGTKTRSCEKLANDLDENAIELNCEMKQDYLRFRFICLNEDFDHAVELLSDIIKNSTFDEFEKEKEKMQGEIIADLDSSRMKALDNYYKNLFENHFYGNTYTRILENIDKIKKEDVTKAFEKIVSSGKRTLSLVGDINFDSAKSTIEKHFERLAPCAQSEKNIAVPSLEKGKTVEIIKSDAQQAQIIQGWIFPTFDSQDYAPIVLLNVILGSAGLSSRLFLELRDKKGLAYTVRSSYEPYEKCASFSIYIATEPKNIQVSLDGFKEEIQKLKDVAVSEEELYSAKNNVIGKQQFITETNSQQANLMAYYETMGLGFDYQATIIERIKAVTPEQIQRVANKYFDDKSIISILRP